MCHSFDAKNSKRNAICSLAMHNSNQLVVDFVIADWTIFIISRTRYLVMRTRVGLRRNVWTNLKYFTCVNCLLFCQVIDAVANDESRYLKRTIWHEVNDWVLSRSARRFEDFFFQYFFASFTFYLLLDLNLVFRISFRSHISVWQRSIGEVCATLHCSTSPSNWFANAVAKNKKLENERMKRIFVICATGATASARSVNLAYDTHQNYHSIEVNLWVVPESNDKFYGTGLRYIITYASPHSFHFDVFDSSFLTSFFSSSSSLACRFAFVSLCVILFDFLLTREWRIQHFLCCARKCRIRWLFCRAHNTRSNKVRIEENMSRKDKEQVARNSIHRTTENETRWFNAITLEWSRLSSFLFSSLYFQFTDKLPIWWAIVSVIGMNEKRIEFNIRSLHWTRQILNL